jgi:D-glycero-alpha-D-manno-heptose 1-phosphate guanylyltransferase
MEAIVLAGGFGTRLKSVISDVPKPMAPIGDKPFLAYLMNYLVNNNIDRIILSTGYMHGVIQEYFGDHFRDIPITYSVEEEPLGTGGAIIKAIEHTKGKSVFILNGDTFFDINLGEFQRLHIQAQAELSIALKRMHNFDRYGTVVIEGNRITNFVEKKYTQKGDINGGIYLVNKEMFNLMDLPLQFSLETDLFQKNLHSIKMSGFTFDGYFIDIGIPEDYKKAQRELILNE